MTKEEKGWGCHAVIGGASSRHVYLQRLIYGVNCALKRMVLDERKGFGLAADERLYI